MALRFRRGAAHDHRGRQLAYLAVACAVALLLPAVGVARNTETASTGPALILTAPPLQVNSSPGPVENPSLWSYRLRPFAAHRSDAVILVNTPNDLLPFQGECSDGPCSLRQAIDKASVDGGDEIVLQDDRYMVTLGTLVIAKPLTIVGAGPTATVIDGSGNVDATTQQLSRIMKIASGEAVSLANLTMTGGVDDNDENLDPTGHSVPTVSLNGGGAIFNNGSLTLVNVVLSNNAANNPIGGAIANDGGGMLGMSDVTFAGNGAGVGGALRIRSGEVSGIGVTFTDNFGEFGGGSVYIDGGFLSLTNSTVDGSAGLNGFGIGIHNAAGQVNLLNVTIAHSQGYALLTDVGASTAVLNTIIGVGGRGDCVPAGRTDSVTNATTASGVTGSGNNNDLDQNGDCSISGANNLTGDPLLTPPGQFGGPTETDALLTGSPAIGAITSGCLPIDQRGVTRGNVCDIGAFEYIGGVQASFSYDPPTPVDGQPVTFTNHSTTSNDASLSYFWDFGDGTTSTEQDPTHAFAAPDTPATYTVTLQATDSTGAVDETFQDIVVQPNKPIAAFTFGAAAPNVPIQFDASSSTDPVGQIVNYDWSWGDDSSNTSGPDAVVEHTYANAGTYTVTLTVTDNGERQDTVSNDVTVAAPTVTDYYVDRRWVDIANGEHVAGPQDQQLTIGTDAFATIRDALAAANEGDPGSTIHVAAGTYTNEGALSLEPDGDQLIGAGRDSTQVNLDSLSVAGAHQVVQGFDLIGPGTWNTTTGCTGCSQPLVRLNGDFSDNAENRVPQDALIQDNRISGGKRGVAFSGGELADFPASGSEVVDNEILHNLTAVYVDSGSHNLVVSNDIHDNGSTSGSPQASVLIVDTKNADPTGNVVQNNAIVNSFGHGISIRTSDNTIADNLISMSGTSYPRFVESSGIELVNDSNDHVDDNFILRNTIYGSAFAGIKLGESSDGGSSIPNDNRITGNTITGTLHAGTTVNSPNFGAAGTAILLTGGGAANTTITGNTLGPNSGYGILQEASEGGSNGTDVHLNAIAGNAGGIRNNDTESIDASQNWWGAGTGPSGAGSGTGDSVSTNVFFDPWLMCPPSASPCTNSTPQASVAAAPSTAPGSLQVAVDASGSVDPDGMIVSYAWDFGDGSTATGATATHTYAAAGTYTVTLTVTDNQGATNTTTHQVTVPAVAAAAPSTPAANQPPHGSFVLTPPGTAGSLQVTVDASASNDPDGTIASYAWSFGDGTSATGATATHTYAAAGTFTITLTVTDNQGAKSTVTQQVTVPVPGAPAPPVPPPVKGVSVDVLPFIGTVLVNGFPLVAGQQIPYGAIVDTTHGTILLQAISPSGQLDAAYFAGAVFKLLYTPGGLTQLVMQGGDFSVCTAPSKRHAAAAGGKPTKKTVVRSLWGNGHGQFVTKGKYAAATVRGTIWNTQDRCDGTFVNVQRGVVSVLDLVRNKTKIVTAGHSFLVAKP